MNARPPTHTHTYTDIHICRRQHIGVVVVGGDIGVARVNILRLFDK